MIVGILKRRYSEKHIYNVVCEVAGGGRIIVQERRRRGNMLSARVLAIGQSAPPRRPLPDVARSVWPPVSAKP